MSFTITPQNKSFVTNNYLLNISEAYKDYKSPSEKYNSEKYNSEKHSLGTPSCNPKINYACPHPNTYKGTYETDNPEEIMFSNIMNGGTLCDFKPRTEINSYLSSRFLTGYQRQPSDYVKDIDTGFYLRHGENSSCSKYWRENHFTDS